MSYATATELEFRLELKRQIDAPVTTVWEAILEEVGPSFGDGNGGSLNMELEAFPGGRWYRHLGEGRGHLWAHVQAIKAPALLEMTGPLMMSLPVSNNVQYRLEEKDGGTELRFVHAAFGPIPADYREGIGEGWQKQLDQIAERATNQRASS